MKKKRPIIRLLVFILPALIQFSSFAQGVIKAEDGARIVSQAGSYWVLDNGAFTLTSPSSAYPVTMANLTIANTSVNTSLTIGPLNYLTVSGTLTNSAGNTGLVVNSNATGAGSLINGTASVQATVNRYITGISRAWHLLSSPVAAQAISGTFTPDPATSYDFFAWYEPTGEWVNFKNTTDPTTWNTANGNNNFTAGKGYLVEYTGAGLTKQFAGNLNAGAVSPALTKTGSVTYAGYNFAGNPYPSAIDWKAATGWTRSSLVVNGGGYSMWILNDAVGQYGTCNSASFSTEPNNGVTRYIPVGQGFMVLAASAGTLGMADGIRIHADQAYLKSTDEIANILRINVAGNANTYSDEIVIEFGHPTADGGAGKMFSFYETAPSLYTVKPDGNYSIDFRGEPGAVTIPLSFKAGADGNYALTASQLESFTSSTAITLEDLKAAKMQNLMQNPSYTFSSAKTDDAARFLLHFGGAFSVNDKEKEQPVSIYGSGNSVNIANKSGVALKGEAIVYNMIGQQVTQRRLDENPLTKISLNGSTGYYFVKVITNENTYSGKVFINQK
ncbi:MAG: T9SS type A sorting domain-containing protein [Bacteroidetes bacterium]|nr:T9SS type A sorting domain-containing protein [Bacteroidota bacterium]